MILVWALLFGAWVRLLAAMQGTFPLNDGGLFYSMVQDILKANYTLPRFASYNAAQIPFAYPPLAFFITAWLHGVARFSLLALLRWLPPLVTLLTLPAFYLLARAVLSSPLQRALSLLFFAMTLRLPSCGRLGKACSIILPRHKSCACGFMMF